MEEPKSKIDELQGRLDSRNQKIAEPHRRSLHGEASDVVPDWQKTDEKESLQNPMKERHHFSVFKKFFIFSAIFFVIAIFFSLYVFFNGANSVSGDNIVITIAGPVAVNGGEALPLDVTVQNKNNAPLQFANIQVQYPQGTKSSEDLSKDLPRESFDAGDLAPGASIHEQIKPVLFGAEGESKEIKISVEYRLRNSSGTFYKDTVYDVSITSTPVSMSISSLKEVNSGQNVEFSVNVVSNSTATIKNFLLTAEYPFGFTFKSATPKPSYDNNAWTLGDIQSGGKRAVTITGKIEGEDAQERVFKFNAGIAKTDDEKSLGVTFLSNSQSITIQKPFIGIDLALNGSGAKDFTTASGQNVRADIEWSNNLSVPINDAVITATLHGALIDKSSVVAEGGFYRSNDNTITWDKSTNDKLGNLSPGDSGTLTFSFTPLPLVQGGVSAHNPSISLDISARGSRLNEQNVPETITSLVDRIVKISTDLNLTSRIVYYSGPFQNSGPIPPKADTPTTYTVIWDVSNNANAVSSGLVKATLPSYVKWLGNVSPLGEKVTFNPVGGEVVWDLGQISENTGVSSSPREAAFQLSYLPSVSQVGTVPKIMSEAVLTGSDEFSGDDLSSTEEGLTTELKTDPNFQSGQDKVVQ